MTSQWQPYHEPLGTTLARAGAIALILGAVLAISLGGGLARWPMATLLALWPALGGHFVEVWHLNWLRPRLSVSRSVRMGARLVVWFVGGCALTVAMCFTAFALNNSQPVRCPAWWVGGLGFIGIELVVHLMLYLRGQPSFYGERA